MPAVALAEIVAFLDSYLEVGRIPDYPNALNGLQVESDGPVRRVTGAVDASEAVIHLARSQADLLVVHHGLFWQGLHPLTGRHFRRVKALIESGTALYSVHLPLDAHARIGNAALLARDLGMEGLEPFGTFKDTHVGWKGKIRMPVETIAERLASLTGSRIHTLPGGPKTVTTVGVITGAGASALGEAAEEGLDALVTGEAQHHHAIEAAEVGVTVFLAGHYATETGGVKEVVALLEDRFGVGGLFVDSPTGL